MSVEKTFRILCIDGGGFKGLYSATVLAEIEKANKPIHKHFDLICGTSTGGIIALGLAAGLSAEAIKQFYLKCGPKIFPHKSSFAFSLAFWKSFLSASKYSSKELKEALRDTFQEKKIRDSKTYICIPTVNLKDGSNVVFKTNHHINLTRDGDFLMRDIALATSSAPTFFPVATVSNFTNGYFIDGGLWANNPSFIGMVEAYCYFVGPSKPYNNFRMLSVPSINHEFPLPINKKRDLSFLDWKEKIFQQIVNSQTKSISQSMKLLSGHFAEKSEFVEIASPTICGVDAQKIGLDIATKDAVEILMGVGEKVGHQYNKSPEVVKFFEREKDPPRFYN